MDPSVAQTGSTLGLALALFGAGLALSLGGWGASIGVGMAGMAASGVITEDPKKFGKMLLFVIIPGTQGFYSFVIFFIISFVKLNMFGTPILPTVHQGLQLLFIGFCAGLVEWGSAIHQGKVAAAAIGIVAKRPEEAGKGFMLPAFVETYAVLGLVGTLLLVLPMKIG